MRPLLAEALGTFWIVLIVSGLLSEGYVAPGLAAGAAAGLAYLGAALSLGQITMGHFSPALTLGLRGAGGFGGSLTLTLVAQVAGAFLALVVVGPSEGERIARPGAAMLLLVPLVALPVVVHVVGMRLRAEAVAYANAVALVVAVALAPGGLSGLNAAYATASWIMGAGAPVGLWRVWAVTIAAVALATWLWSLLAPEDETTSLEDMEEDAALDGDAAEDETDAEDDDEAGTEAARTAGKSASSEAHPRRRKTVGSEAPGGEAEPVELLAARHLTADALVAAGWRPPDTKKGRIQKNTPRKRSGR